MVGGEAEAFLAGCRERFDLILLDPPYAAGLLEGALEMISRFDILANHGIIVCESPVDQEMPAVKAPLFLHRPLEEMSPPYRFHRTYRYGRIKITTYHREEGREA